MNMQVLRQWGLESVTNFKPKEIIGINTGGLLQIGKTYYRIFDDETIKIIFKWQENDKKEIMIQIAS